MKARIRRIESAPIIEFVGMTAEQAEHLTALEIERDNAVNVPNRRDLDVVHFVRNVNGNYDASVMTRPEARRICAVVKQHYPEVELPRGFEDGEPSLSGETHPMWGGRQSGRV